MATKTLDYTALLKGGLFSGNNGKKRKVRKEKTRTIENFPVHFFPSHKDAPYFGSDGLFSKYGMNAQYTANFLLDLEKKNGCSQDSIDERMYIALMARAKILHKDKPEVLEDTLIVLEDAVVSDVAKRYSHIDGWTEDYVRYALLPTCVNAMVEGFKVKNNLLLKMYEQLLKGR